MKVAITFVSLALLATTADAQTRRFDDFTAQQKYNRIELPADELVKQLEEAPEVVSVRLEQRGKDMIVQTDDRALRIENSDEFSKYTQRLPYDYRFEASDEEGAVNASVEQLTAVQRWRDTDFATKGDFSNLQTAYDELDLSAIRIANANASDTDLEDFKLRLAETKGELISAYQVTDDADVDAQRRLVENYQEVERAGKALYGRARDDRYPPETYQRIYDNSRGALAIMSDEGGVHCSGVLIADEYALTNEHCTTRFFITELKVRFDYEERLDGSNLPTRTLDVVEKVTFTNAQRKGYDFAILKLDTDKPDNNVAGDLYPVQCIGLSRVRRNDPLYLIGHPLGEPRTVHDNTFVYFPFRVTQEEFTELEMAVRSEFLGADDELARLEEFRSSYQRRDEGGVPVYENFSRRWDLQPTIGVDSDTFHGNSGSPAYSRKSHNVVGILFDGEDDLDEPWNVGWRAHEAVLPIEVVVERLDDIHPEWRNWEGVCIQ